MQKIQKNGRGDVRYFWNVNVVGEGAGEYRSRHSTALAVGREFKKNGKRVISVTATQAVAR